ncbi:MAG: hypothetical protein Q9168_004876 [Polycauliona sp. 1 TL-2023]
MAGETEAQKKARRAKADKRAAAKAAKTSTEKTGMSQIALLSDEELDQLAMIRQGLQKTKNSAMKRDDDGMAIL